MNIPESIAELVEQAWQDLPSDNPARAHHGIPLLLTLGAMLVLRSDGVILDLWPEYEPGWPTSDGKSRIVSSEEGWIGIVAGSEAYPWLADLIPLRPTGAIDCDKCEGRGRVPVTDWRGETVTMYCGDCSALGWRPSAKAVQQ